MNQIIKKFGILIVLLLVCLPISAYDFEVDGFYYNVIDADKNQVEVTYKDKKYNSYSGPVVVIPSTVTNDGTTYTVTAIGEDAFSGCKQLKSVTFANSVETIGDYAFSGCINIESLVLGSSLSSIGNRAFSDHNAFGWNTYAISKVTWLCNTPPKGVYEISAERNYVSNNLFLFKNQVVYPFLSSRFEVDNVVYVPVSPSDRTCDVIDCNYNPTSGDIKIGNVVNNGGEELKVSKVNDYSFYCNDLITSLEIGNPVTSIGESAFSGCKQLKSVTLANSVETIGDEAFYDCSNIQSLILGSSLSSIGDDAFSYNHSGGKYTIPKVIWLCNTPPKGGYEISAERNYVSNNQFSFKNKVVYPFLSSRFEVDNVVYVPVSPSDRTCDVIDCNYNPTSGEIKIGSVVNNRGVELKVLNVNDYSFYNNKSITSLEISNGGNIGSYAFYECDALTSVEASNNGNIGSYAFYQCDALTSVLASNDGYIGEKSFYNCNALTKVTASNNGNIGSQAFYKCGALTSVTVSNNGDIGERAFYDCDALTSVEASNNGNIGSQAFYDCGSLKEVEISIDGNIGSSAFEGCVNLTDLHINEAKNLKSKAFYGCTEMQTAILNNTGSIGSQAFYGCNMSKQLSIGSGVTSIGESAFANNVKLKELVIPGNVQSLGNSAFFGCEELENVSIGKGVSSLPESVFNWCKSLPSISIPPTVISIGDNVFSGCSSLADVTFEDALEDENATLSIGDSKLNSCPLDEVYIGRILKYEPNPKNGFYSPFYNNKTLRTVTISDLETTIYDNEFYGCSNLQSFSCGDGVTSIGKWAFSGCSSLKSYSSGTNVTTIGEEAFSDCNGLASFTTLASVPPTCGKQALDDINKWECTLHVPSESIDDYKTAEQWKEFFFIEDVIAGVDSVIDGDEAIALRITSDGFIFEGDAALRISVYGLDGEQIFSSMVQPFQKVNLSSGLYVVKVGQKAIKVRI